MAATRLIALHKNRGKSVAACLKSRTDYAKNPDKTNKGELVSSYDKRPEIRKLAQEQLDMRFHPERLASDDADEFEDLLLNKDDEDEDEW